MGAAKESRAEANEYALVGWLALLPLAVLAWPFAGSPVRTALEPELAGAAVLALAALPAIGFVALTRRSSAAFGLTPLFVYAVGCFASLRLRPPADTLEADRATLLLLGALALALVGASTRRGARERFVAGVVGLALLLLGAALFDREHGFAGVLQNTGASPT
ncbi:MAG: hypothetical protein HZA52_01730 [Planctomycetes bacterium]|nr:hypothetical protein [Planctomycetota bacterium]